MGTATGRTAAKIEDAETLIRRPLDECPIQQHVCVAAVIFLEGRYPGQLEFASPLKSAAGGYWYPLMVRTTDPHVLRKLLGESLEEPSWQRGCAEVAHVPREHLVESVQLFEPEPDVDAILLRVAHLPAHV